MQRECEEVSVIINRLLMEELAARRIPYVMVSGAPDQRLAQVQRLLATAT